jgi:hypothetical protein
MSDQDSSVLLESNPEFQKLSDEAKSIVRNKFHSGFVNLSPEAQAIVKQKLGPAPQAEQQQSLAKRAYDIANVPRTKAREGLGMLAEAGSDAQNAIAQKTGLPVGTEPTGNMAADIARGTPRVLADTLTDVAPDFVSPASLMTMGAGKVASLAAKTAMGAKGAAALEQAGLKATKGLESLSGAQPGTVVAAVKDPMLAFRPGPEAASQLYQEGKTGMKALSMNAGKVPTVDRIYAEGTKAIADGSANPRQALQVRKAIDKMLKSKQYDKEVLLEWRQKADALVKGSEKMAGGDAAFVKGLKAESARTLFPTTSTGKTAVVRTAALAGSKGLAAPFVSPAIQAGMGAVVGAGARAAAVPFQPGVVPLVQALHNAYQRRKKR